MLFAFAAADALINGLLFESAITIEPPPCAFARLAIVNDSDLSALAIYDVLSNAGVKVGKDIFLVGYGDLENYGERPSQPVLSTISANAERIGETLGKALLNQISGKKETEIVAKTVFISRETFPVK